MEKTDTDRTVKGCMIGFCTVEGAKCDGCGWQENIYKERKQIPLTEDPETGLRRKVIRNGWCSEHDENYCTGL